MLGTARLPVGGLIAGAVERAFAQPTRSCFQEDLCALALAHSTWIRNCVGRDDKLV